MDRDGGGVLVVLVGDGGGDGGGVLIGVVLGVGDGGGYLSGRAIKDSIKDLSKLFFLLIVDGVSDRTT